MTWAAKRKLAYGSVTIGVLALVAGFFIHKYTTVPPTCYDNKKNGDETGVDCGGSCNFYCINELSNPKVRWVRAFQIVPGVYHVLAYIEHSNPAASAETVSYDFKLYDENNTLIAERPGTTFIGPFGKSAIVETLVRTGSFVPAVTRFEFTSPIKWGKISPEFAKIVINTDKRVFDTSAKDSTRLIATLENKSRFGFIDMDTVAILYDTDDNAITAVKILVPELGPLESKTVYFTWPFKITQQIGRVEIIPRINPFTTTVPK